MAAVAVVFALSSSWLGPVASGTVIGWPAAVMRRDIGQAQVVATGLDSPQHLSVGPDGALYVAEGGHFDATSTDCFLPVAPPGPTQCLSTTGAVARIAGGVVSTVLSGLPSVGTSGGGAQPASASGPAAVTVVGGNLVVVTHDADTAITTGANPFGPQGAALGHILTAAPGSASSQWAIGSDLALFAAHNLQTPTTDPTGLFPKLSPAFSARWASDPSDIVPFGSGYAAVDAAANTLLKVNVGITPLASFLAHFSILASSRPSSVTVGPDGALYVGELVGTPSPAGAANVYRVFPGTTPSIFASGFSAISDLAFDQAGRLLVLEQNTGGLGSPTPGGALIRVEHDGSRTTVASNGIVDPTGLAVAPDGSIYISNYGGAFAASSPSGQIVRITLPPAGYNLVASDGGVFSLGQNAFYGSAGGLRLNSPVVATASVPDGPGYWLVGSDGGVFTYGGAGFYGSAGALHLNNPIVGVAPTPDGRGYWLAASDGGIFSFGDAGYYGSTGALHLNKPIVGVAPTPDGRGYWLAASDGGIFAFGDAGYYGSTGALHLNKPIVGVKATPDGTGYWLAASDGGIFSFGAPFLGALGNVGLVAPIIGVG